MLTQFLEAGNPGGIVIHSQDAPQMPLGKAVKIVAGRQGRNMNKNHFRQVEQVHNLSHAGARNACVSCNFGLRKRFVLSQHDLPFQSDPDRIPDTKFRCIFDIRLGFYIMAGGFRIPERMDDKRLCAPPGKGNAHEDGG